MSAEGLNGVKAGDNLVLVTGNRFRGDEPVTVSRVGRQYLYISANGKERRERYDRKTGVEVDQRGLQERLLTQAQYEEMTERKSLFMNLLAAGIDVRHEKRAEMSTGKLRALLAVVQDEGTARTDEK